MDFQRLILFVIFTLSSFQLWNAWQRYNHPESFPVAQVAAGSSSVPQAPGNWQGSSPSASTAGALTFPVGQQATVDTDQLHVVIDADGGDLRQLDMVHYVDPADKKQMFHILQQQPDHLFVAQSGLIGADLPNHRAVFHLQPGEYRMAPGQDTLAIPLEWTSPDGQLSVQKQYVFHRGSDLIEVNWQVSNHGPAAIPVDAYYQFVRDGKKPETASRMIHTFTGPALYTSASKFVKIDFSKLDKHDAEFPHQANNGWMAMVQHHFVTVWLPANGKPREFFARALGEGLYSAGVILPEGNLAAGQTTRFSMPLYAGPQIQSVLTGLAPGLDYVIDYGWLTPIAVPIFWLLQHIHALVGNWGWAIVILTISIKLLFFPLSAKSYRSMAQMRGLSPKLQKLKEQFADDREKLHLAMMDLYKTEKVNPLGGCLPTVVQIPVFIALYWTLVGSVEMRQAPFIGWIHDLSAPDPYYVLPIIMGLTMILQARLNPAPPDPMQAKVMMIMPIVFSVFFLFFPAGLVLYWVVNNLMSIGQQWVITRQFEARKGASKAD